MGSMTRSDAAFDVPGYSAGTPMTNFEGDRDYVALYTGESCDLGNDVKPTPASGYVELVAACKLPPLSAGRTLPGLLAF